MEGRWRPGEPMSFIGGPSLAFVKRVLGGGGGQMEAGRTNIVRWWAFVGCHWPLWAFVDLRWPPLAVVGRCGPSLTCVGVHWPLWAFADLRWPLLAFVGCHWLLCNKNKINT